MLSIKPHTFLGSTAAPVRGLGTAVRSSCASRAYQVGQLHLVMNNCDDHTRVEIRDWLAAETRINFRVTLPP